MSMVWLKASALVPNHSSAVTHPSNGVCERRAILLANMSPLKTMPLCFVLLIGARVKDKPMNIFDLNVSIFPDETTNDLFCLDIVKK